MNAPKANGANGANGRDARGRFARGNKGGPGNPRCRRAAALRQLLVGAVSDDDFRAVVAKLVDMAKAGDLAAIRELFDRMLGRPVGIDELRYVEQHELIDAADEARERDRPDYFGGDWRKAAARLMEIEAQEGVDGAD